MIQAVWHINIAPMLVYKIQGSSILGPIASTVGTNRQDYLAHPIGQFYHQRFPIPVPPQSVGEIRLRRHQRHTSFPHQELGVDQ